MKVDGSTIWQVPAYLPYVQPPLTDRAVAEAEARIGFRLPSEYLTLLRTQNGGYIRLSLPESIHRQIFGIGPYYPSITDVNWDDDRENVSMGLDGLVPFDGDGLWHMCLDYRKNTSAPCVTYADVECDRESKIADSFADYLQLLRWDIGDNDFVLLSVSDIEAVKSAVGGFLGVTFGQPSSEAHGYPEHRARVSHSDEPEWLWISPNLVPRGFVRENDSRYKQLRNMMPGMARRYPMLPDESFVVSFTDRVGPAVLDAFRAGSIELHPIKILLADQGL